MSSASTSTPTFSRWCSIEEALPGIFTKKQPFEENGWQSGATGEKDISMAAAAAMLCNTMI